MYPLQNNELNLCNEESHTYINGIRVNHLNSDTPFSMFHLIAIYIEEF